MRLRCRRRSSGRMGGKGFSFYMLRAVLNGRTDEVVGLANTHFRRARRVRSAESL